MERIRIFNKPIPFTCLAINVFVITNFIFDQNRDEKIIGQELANDPEKVIQGEFWRLYTSFLTHQNIQQLLFSSYLLIMEGAAFENLIGSVTYLLLFVVKMFLVSIVYCIWYLGLKGILNFDNTAINPIAQGTWIVILSDLVSRTFLNPNELRIFKLLPNKIYTFILLLIGFYVSYLGVHVLAIITIAYIEHKCFNGLIFRPYKSHVKCVEQYTCFAIFKKCFKFSFVTIDEVNENFFRIERSDHFETMQIPRHNQDLNDSSDQNDMGKLEIQQSYYSQNKRQWKQDDEYDENIQDDVENPNQERKDVEIEMQQ